MTEGRMPPRVRIAPSPTGDPHVGTAYIALFNRTFAQKHGGQFILRIEDTDRARSTRESEEAIYRALGWLGLNWDEGPDVGGPHGPYRQSERSDIYRSHAELLIERGAAYRCFCTAERLAEMRERQKKEKQNFGYDGTCRDLSAEEQKRYQDEGTPFVVRHKVPNEGSTVFKDLLREQVEIQNKETDDQVLMKSDGFPTYHLANVVDDHEMGVTHVMRAEEWIPSTPKHVLLYEAFGWEPPVFCHLPLLRNKDKTKISKRKNPTSLDWYRDHGFLPEAIRNFLSLMGWFPKDGVEVFDDERLLRDFRPEDINTTGPVFDMQKLEWMNGEYIRALDTDDLFNRIVAFYPDRSIDEKILRAAVPLIQERMKTLCDFDTVAPFFFEDPTSLTAEDFAGAKKIAPEDRVDALRAARDIVAAADAPGPNLDDKMRDACNENGWKVGGFFMCVRLAATGSKASPPLLESMEVLGKEVCLRRLDAAIALLSAS